MCKNMEYFNYRNDRNNCTINDRIFQTTFANGINHFL